ncbi:hypothetical protein KZX45_10965 [Georgenia sp. EYE_87]|nr:hypothetical protein [Georgenia sp. EYE_87]MCK6211065.1 hypothetical protein [Georgenia sp. EYE_87]
MARGENGPMIGIVSRPAAKRFAIASYLASREERAQPDEISAVEREPQLA